MKKIFQLIISFWAVTFGQVCNAAAAANTVTVNIKPEMEASWHADHNRGHLFLKQKGEFGSTKTIGTKLLEKNLSMPIKVQGDYNLVWKKPVGSRTEEKILKSFEYNGKGDLVFFARYTNDGDIIFVSEDD